MRRICVILALLASAGCGAVRKLDEAVTRQSGEIAVLDHRIAELRSLAGRAERSSAGTLDEVLTVREVYGGASQDSSGRYRPVLRETVRRRRSVTSSTEAASVSGTAVAAASAAESAAAADSEEKSVSSPAAEDGRPGKRTAKARRLLTRLGLSAAAILLAALAARVIARHPNGIRMLFKGIFRNK